MIQLLLSLSLVSVCQQVVPTKGIAMGMADYITQVHVQSILDRHHLSYRPNFTWSCAFLVLHPPADLIKILDREAPRSRFSLYVYKDREFNSPYTEAQWTRVISEGLATANQCPFSVEEFLRAEGVSRKAVKQFKFMARIYDTSDGKSNTGYEISITDQKGEARFQIFGSHGRQAILGSSAAVPTRFLISDSHP